MSRREECSSCGADQHVCSMCVFYDRRHRGSCNEERAESVSDSERANFCDYFKPSNTGLKDKDARKSAEAKAKFAALFEDQPLATNEQINKAENVQEDQVPTQALSPKQLAEQKLRDLLGG